MNVFRLTADLMHLASIVILLLKITKTRSCAGMSLVLLQSIPWNRRQSKDPDAVCLGLCDSIFGSFHALCVALQHIDEDFLYIHIHLCDLRDEISLPSNI